MTYFQATTGRNTPASPHIVADREQRRVAGKDQGALGVAHARRRVRDAVAQQVRHDHRVGARVERLPLADAVLELVVDGVEARRVQDDALARADRRAVHLVCERRPRRQCVAAGELEARQVEVLHLRVGEGAPVR